MHGDVEVVVRSLPRKVDDVVLGVNVDHPALVIDHGQRRDALLGEEVEDDNQRRVGLDLVKGKRIFSAMRAFVRRGNHTRIHSGAMKPVTTAKMLTVAMFLNVPMLSFLMGVFSTGLTASS